MKLKRSTIIPVALLVYLAVMSVIGWRNYSAGLMSALYYYGIIAATLAVIVLLHFNLKRRERLRAEREADIREAEAKRKNEENKTN